MFSNVILSLRNIESKVLFNYILIMLVSFVMIGKKRIKLSHIFSLLISLSIIYYLRLNQLNDELNDGNKKQEKIKLIKPNIDKIKYYDDIVNYLYSIQDLYIYNPEAYEEIIINLELFLEVYENTKLDNIYYTQYYKIADRVRRTCLNNLQSIIFNIGNEMEVKMKLNNAIIGLNEIFNEYMDDLYNISKEKIEIYGYDSKTIPINNDIPAYNEYEVKDYTFNIY